MTVKRAPWLVVAGAVAGFAGIIGFHVGAAAPLAGPGAEASGTPRSTPEGSSSAGASGPARTATGPARTATGPDVNFSYGTISVRVAVRGSRIVAVSVAAVRALEPQSGQITGNAIPMLQSEVLSAQSASIDGISGATYTSRGFISSLQAALNDLRT
ncbi:MAG: FMN-binding protein [Streptosporangiaceae bacterium]